MPCSVLGAAPVCASTHGRALTPVQSLATTEVVVFSIMVHGLTLARLLRRRKAK